MVKQILKIFGSCLVISILNGCGKTNEPIIWVATLPMEAIDYEKPSKAIFTVQPGDYCVLGDKRTDGAFLYTEVLCPERGYGWVDATYFTPTTKENIKPRREHKLEIWVATREMPVYKTHEGESQVEIFKLSKGDYCAVGKEIFDGKAMFYTEVLCPGKGYGLIVSPRPGEFTIITKANANVVKSNVTSTVEKTDSAETQSSSKLPQTNAGLRK